VNLLVFDAHKGKCDVTCRFMNILMSGVHKGKRRNLPFYEHTYVCCP
jgi:hypothetical protein